MPTPKPTPKPKMNKQPMPKLKTWGAGSSEKEIRSVGKGTSINQREAAAKAKLYAGNNEYVNPVYGPIAGSAE